MTYNISYLIHQKFILINRLIIITETFYQKLYSLFLKLAKLNFQ